jgi:hypothetical protein
MRTEPVTTIPTGRTADVAGYAVPHRAGDPFDGRFADTGAPIPEHEEDREGSVAISEYLDAPDGLDRLIELVEGGACVRVDRDHVLFAASREGEYWQIQPFEPDLLLLADLLRMKIRRDGPLTITVGERSADATETPAQPKFDTPERRRRTTNTNEPATIT